MNKVRLHVLNSRDSSYPWVNQDYSLDSHPPPEEYYETGDPQLGGRRTE